MTTFWKILTRKKVLDPTTVQQSNLARVLNTFDLTALGVGSTLGVGLYVLVGKVAKETAGPAVVLSFLIAAVASVFAALCYAEFGARTPRAGSAYVYSYVCVGEFVAFVIGWNLILEYVIGSASVARGISLYIDALVNNTIQNTFIDIAPIHVSFLAPYFDFLAFGIVIVLSAGLAFGMKESSWANNIFTGLNLLVVLFIVIAGSTKADPHNWNLPVNDTDVGKGGFFPFGIEGMIKGAATCFYAFIGFDCIATTGEEVRNPQKAIPFAIIMSLLIVFLCYFATSTVITLMVPYYLQDVSSPIPHAFQQYGWSVGIWIVTIGGILALFASLFGAMFPLPRIIYAMAQDELIFKFLGRVHSRFSTPVIGTMIAGLLTGFMAALIDQDKLINMMSIGTLQAYTIVAACVLLLRYSVDDDNDYLVQKEPDTSAGYSEDQFEAKPDSDEAGAERLPISWYRQIFNLNRVGVPTKLSENIVAVAVTVYCILCCAFSLCLIFLSEEISNGAPYAITLPSVILLLMLIVLLSIWLQPKSDKSTSFQVPWIPLIPAVSILINVYLMFSLDVDTWIRLGIWMAIGLPIYFYSALCRKQKAPNKVLAVTTNENGDVKRNNLDEGYLVVDEKPHNGVAAQHDWKRMSAFHNIRKISVDTISCSSNTVLEENVVAIIHREDVPIVEEEENEEDIEQNDKIVAENFMNHKVNSKEEEKSQNTENLLNKQNSISTEIIEVVEELERVIKTEEDKDRSNEAIIGNEENKDKAIEELEIIEANEEDNTNKAIEELENVIENEENNDKTKKAIEELENVIENEEHKDNTNKAIEELETVIENEEQKEAIEELENMIKNEEEKIVVEELEDVIKNEEAKSVAKESEENKSDNSVIKTEEASSSEEDKDKNNNTYHIPPPPPMGDFEKLVTIPTIPRFPRLSSNNKFTKNKPYIPPTDYTEEENELPDSIKLGSSDHDKLKNKLSAILINKVPTKLTKPPVNTEEIDDVPLRKKSLEPIMSRIISQIPLKESGESSEDEELSLEEIKKKLNSLFQTTKAKSPVNQVKKQEVQRKNSLTFPRSVKVSKDGEDYEDHKKLMQMTFSKIKLRRSSSQLFANT